MTIKDLAIKTGYAVGTVSRALNDHPNVSEKARAAILKAAAESGFELNVNAKQLKQQHATTILVVVKGTANELFSELLEIIQSRIAEMQYPLYVDYLDEAANEVRRALQLCREKKPLGILFLGGNIQNFRTDFDKIDIPCVVLTNSMAALNYPNLSSVTVDDVEACRCAVDSLVERGHRKIAAISGDPETSDVGRARYEGCLKSLRNHGIEFDPQQDFRGIRFSYQDGYNATMDLLEKGRTFTALFTASDVMAVGAIRALHEKGLRVPEDVSVIGFDGLAVGSFMIPKLSSVVQPAHMMANRAIEILISQFDGNVQSVHEMMPFELLDQESVATLNR